MATKEVSPLEMISGKLGGKQGVFFPWKQAFTKKKVTDQNIN